jgi:hypothetical protein
MGKTPSAAERANRITYFLKGDLKRIRIQYIRAGAKLAQIRDEKLYRALKHESLEDYAEQRLGLGRSALYRYLQIYEWVRKDHPRWLAKHPKGFIPELTDAYGLMWIEERLDDEHLEPETRKELEALRNKGLEGKLTKQDVERFKRRGEKRRDSITAVAASLRAVRRRAAALAGFPRNLLHDLDAFLDRLKSASGAVTRAARFANPRGMRISAAGWKSPPGGLLRERGTA